ncbi:M16 family metallopeptidase [Flavihumibacter solisilvae]|uniref:Peptidase n=1 Tax=Flavihumibacter solisilvae TaxID=1349421 RepID=A0A0C1L597_9BACT|nr:pitrilysin family protein [Flavihumibacter solisilvae]KIC95287.1 peptidase [Flavihumibacter solisilvae]
MKVITSILTCLAVTTTGLLSFAQETLPPAGKPKDFKLPVYKKMELPNGMKATMIPYGNIPKVTVELVIRTGQVHEPKVARWLAKYTGKFLEEGSTKNDLASLSKKVAAMGGRLTVSVGMETISIGGSVLAEFAPEFLGLLAELVTDPAFPASSADRLKNDLKRDLSVRKAQPDAQASEKFFTMIYGDHPYSNKLPTEEMLAALSVEKAKKFYADNFGAQRSSIYIAGNFDQKAVEQSITKSFSSWTKGPAINYPPAVQQRSNEIAIVERPDAPQTVILLGTPVPDPKSAEYTQLEITNSLLGGSFGSRITRNIREDKGYTYSPYSTIQNRQKMAVWYEKADVTSEHTAASLAEISKEIRGLQEKAPDIEELKGIQNYEAGSFVLTNSSADGIIDQLVFIDMNSLKDSYLTNRIKDIYSVTPQQVQNMTKKHLRYEDMTLVLVGDKKQIDNQLEEIKKTRAVKKAF